MKRVFFLAASDRLNYGDLLFPLIFNEVFKERGVEFNNYGLVKSNLSHFGALPTRSYRRLLSDIKKGRGNLVIGGGEVFFPSWEFLFAYISPTYRRLMRSYKLKKTEGVVRFARRYLSGGRVEMPFTPGPDELSNAAGEVNVIYNAVGGHFSADLDRRLTAGICKKLSSSAYLSVRDNRTRDSLRRESINSQLSPDSALIMSDIFDPDRLARSVTLEKGVTKDDYLFLQLAIHKGPREIGKFAAELEKYSSRLGLKVILSPIGIAPGHEDQVILRKIAQFSDRFMLIMPGNLFDTMHLIAESTCYLGTSLHGLITAQSFGVPFIPLNEKVEKLDAYRKTWAGDICSGMLSFDQLDELEERLAGWDGNMMKRLTTAQKGMVYQNFKNIEEVLI